MYLILKNVRTFYASLKPYVEYKNGTSSKYKRL